MLNFLVHDALIKKHLMIQPLPSPKMAWLCPSEATILFSLVGTPLGLCGVGTLAMSAKAVRTGTTAVPAQVPLRTLQHYSRLDLECPAAPTRVYIVYRTNLFHGTIYGSMVVMQAPTTVSAGTRWLLYQMPVMLIDRSFTSQRCAFVYTSAGGAADRIAAGP